VLTLLVGVLIIIHINTVLLGLVSCMHLENTTRSCDQTMNKQQFASYINHYMTVLTYYQPVIFTLDQLQLSWLSYS